MFDLRQRVRALHKVIDATSIMSLDLSQIGMSVLDRASARMDPQARRRLDSILGRIGHGLSYSATGVDAIPSEPEVREPEVQKVSEALKVPGAPTVTEDPQPTSPSTWSDLGSAITRMAEQAKALDRHRTVVQRRAAVGIGVIAAGGARLLHSVGEQVSRLRDVSVPDVRIGRVWWPEPSADGDADSDPEERKPVSETIIDPPALPSDPLPEVEPAPDVVSLKPAPDVASLKLVASVPPEPTATVTPVERTPEPAVPALVEPPVAPALVEPPVAVDPEPRVMAAVADEPSLAMETAGEVDEIGQWATPAPSRWSFLGRLFRRRQTQPATLFGETAESDAEREADERRAVTLDRLQRMLAVDQEDPSGTSADEPEAESGPVDPERPR